MPSGTTGELVTVVQPKPNPAPSLSRPIRACLIPRARQSPRPVWSLTSVSGAFGTIGRWVRRIAVVD